MIPNKQIPEVSVAYNSKGKSVTHITCQLWPAKFLFQAVEEMCFSSLSSHLGMKAKEVNFYPVCAVLFRYKKRVEIDQLSCDIVFKALTYTWEYSLSKGCHIAKFQSQWRRRHPRADRELIVVKKCIIHHTLQAPKHSAVLLSLLVPSFSCFLGPLGSSFLCRDVLFLFLIFFPLSTFQFQLKYHFLRELPNVYIYVYMCIHIYVYRLYMYTYIHMYMYIYI